MEPGDLQPLTVYNEHAPGARGHRHPQQAFGVSKEVIGRGSVNVEVVAVVVVGGVRRRRW